ncbi:hypothetical protein BC567DRAFT_238368 [Phyllosticta citribraziliensis]
MGRGRARPGRGRGSLIACSTSRRLFQQRSSTAGSNRDGAGGEGGRRFGEPSAGPSAKSGLPGSCNGRVRRWAFVVCSSGSIRVQSASLVPRQSVANGDKGIDELVMMDDRSHSRVEKMRAALGNCPGNHHGGTSTCDIDCRGDEDSRRQIY